MARDLIIIGAGETAHLAYEYFTHDSDHEVAAFAVEKQYRESNEFLGLPLVDFESVKYVFSANEAASILAMVCCRRFWNA